MKKIINLSLFSILFLLLTACNEDKIDFVQTGKLTGKVVISEDFEPMPNVKITLNPTNNTAFTNEQGEFVFDEVQTGDYAVRAEKQGYLTGNEPITISADQTANVVFEMDLSSALNKPPLAPTLLSPADNSTGHPLEVDLVWSKAVDPDDDELKYGLIIRNDFDSTVLTINDLTDTIYSLDELRHGVKYFWQVKVSDEINSDVLSDTRAFETSSFPNNRYLYVRNVGGNDVIYSSNEENENILLSSLGSNSWRPRKNLQTQTVAFLKNVSSETHLFTMNPDGTNVHQVTNQNTVSGFKQNEMDYAWSTNGSKLVYPSFNKLYIINKDGSGNELLFQTSNGNFITEVDWSYDGSKLAIKTNDINGYHTSILIIKIDGEILNTVVANGIGAYGGLNFSTNGQFLLYTHDFSQFEDASYRQFNSHILLYNTATGISGDISINKDAGYNDLDPRFSPNEAKIIFTYTSNDGVSIKNVYTMDIDGENRELLFENAFMPDWE